MEQAWIILADERGNGFADACGLIPRRNNGGNGGPLSAPYRAVVIALRRQPESAPRREQIQPDRQHH
jgi:hypothetical protein